MKYEVELLKTICLGTVEVEAENESEAEKKAYWLFNKHDRDDCCAYTEIREIMEDDDEG